MELSFTEFQILSLLARLPGWVYTRAHIVDAVHGNDYPVTDRSVGVQIEVKKAEWPYLCLPSIAIASDEL